MEVLMVNKLSLQKLCIAALLIAVGIVIPMFSPLRIVLEPASFTLASHVAVFIAIMISPVTAAMVALGTAAGFFFGGFPVIVVLRAATHFVFALLGALYLKIKPQTLKSPVRVRVVSLAMAVIHAVCEVTVVSVFYFGGTMTDINYSNGFFKSVILLVGLGTIVHSMVDYEIAFFIYKILKKQKPLDKIFL